MAKSLHPSKHQREPTATSSALASSIHPIIVTGARHARPAKSNAARTVRKAKWDDLATVFLTENGVESGHVSGIRTFHN